MPDDASAWPLRIYPDELIPILNYSYLLVLIDALCPVLGEIATDCENTHDEVLLTYFENYARDLYYRFNVSQGMQVIMLDEWRKKDDIKIYTDKYLEAQLNGTRAPRLSQMIVQPSSEHS